MKRKLLVLLSGICMMLAALPAYSQNNPSKEKKTDRRIERRTDRSVDRKNERRDAIRDPETAGGERRSDRKIDRRTERQGERKEERRDAIRGEDRKSGSNHENVPGEQIGEAQEGLDNATGEGEGRALFEENSQQRREMYQENMPQRHDLFDENSSQRRELKSALDSSGDGKISKEEVAEAKDMVRALYEENSAKRQELYEENKGERHTLYAENSQQRLSLLKTFDLDADDKISEQEMEDAFAVLDSMEE